MVLLGGLSTQFTGELVECRVVPCGVAITSSHAGVFKTGARCCLIHTDLCAKLKVTLVESEKLTGKFPCDAVARATVSIVCTVRLRGVWLLHTAVWESIALKSAALPPFLVGLKAAKADKASLIKLILPILPLVFC